MDNYLEHLIKQVLDNDTGKMERYYKNEVNKDGVSREAIIVICKNIENRLLKIIHSSKFI